MSGEFLGEYEYEDENPAAPVAKQSTRFETEVEGVYADDSVPLGADKFPVFDVSAHEFYQNSNYGRRQMNFDPDTPVDRYLKGSTVTRPFYLRHNTERTKAIKKVS